MSVTDEVICPSCAVETLRRWVGLGGEPMREFKCPVVLVLDCGHRRPSNVQVGAGDEHPCLLCGPARVVGVEPLEEHLWFPHVDALHDLPSPR